MNPENSESSPSVVVLGGTRTFRDLAQAYAGLSGWRRVEELDSSSLKTAADWAAWRRWVAEELLGTTRSGERILVLADRDRELESWTRRVMRAGRKVEVPLAGLPPEERLMRLHHWIALKEAEARITPSPNAVRTPRQAFERLVRVLFEKHPGAGRAENRFQREGRRA